MLLKLHMSFMLAVVLSGCQVAGPSDHLESEDAIVMHSSDSSSYLILGGTNY